MALHGCIQFIRYCGRAVACAELARTFSEQRRIVSIGARRRAFDILSADEQLNSNVLSRRDAFLQIGAPGLEAVDPALDCVEIMRERRDAKFRFPAIITRR